MATQSISRPSRVGNPIPNAQLGMLLFVATEVMFFVALISAYLVIKASSGIRWVPPGDVTLPVAITAVNTAILLASGVFMVLATRAFEGAGSDRDRSLKLFTASLVLGVAFVGIQGMEWVELLSHGLTMRSGVFGACFFLLIGSHGLHAFAAVIALLFTLRSFKRGTLTVDHFKAMQIFWLFIVGVWPFLYVLVYL